MCALCVSTFLCVLSCKVYRCIHHMITNRSVLCLNRSSMSYTVKWAPPSSFVRSVLRTTKTSRSNPVVTLCALPASRPGRYCNELCCMNSFQGQTFDWIGTSAALAVHKKLGVLAESVHVYVSVCNILSIYRGKHLEDHM